MEKLDLKKEFKHLYAPSSKAVEIVDVPRFNFAMLDGCIGAGMTPETSTDFQEAFGALYGISYTLKFMSKLRRADPIDYSVMAMEGLWWTESGEFDPNTPGDWMFTMMILQPDFISEEMFQEALQKLKAKKDSPALSRLRLSALHEGLSMQIMHVGPYEQEPRTIEKMQGFARENGYRQRGRHHEIYLGDPRRSKPERLRTILRHPIERDEPGAD